MKSAPMFLLLYILLSCTSCTKTHNAARPSSLPMLTTTPVNAISNDTAISGGSIYSDGGLSIIERGIVWDTDSLPTIALSTKTLNGIDTGTFQSHLTGLNCFTKYYLRAYATNAVGTAYGNQITFTTSTSIGWEHLNI